MALHLLKPSNNSYVHFLQFKHLTINYVCINKLLLTMRILLIVALSLMVKFTSGQTVNKMKLNAGVITEKLQESKDFYTKFLDFGVTFENEFYILMHTPDKSAEISFLKPNHPSQKPIFQKPFTGEGTYLTIEVENVDEFYEKLKSKNVEIEIELRDETWGDRHFAIVDPNGIGIDILTHTKPKE